MREYQLDTGVMISDFDMYLTWKYSFFHWHKMQSDVAAKQAFLLVLARHP